MKKLILLAIICVVTSTVTHAQKWSDLTDEQKAMKLKSFRAENQKYLKDSLGLTPTQITDVDNVNLCYLSTLDRINRYVKDDTKKNDYAEALSKVRWAQVDGIMGADKHDKYVAYLERKIAKANK